MTIDFDGFFRNRIETLLIKASWVNAIQSMTGLKATSQVWNGRAEWYLWLDRAPGVYALAFMDGEDVYLGERCFHEGLFTVKCYPYRNHAAFTHYSSDERRLIESDWFDATNTPCFEALAQIPDSLFSIGSFSLTIDPHGSLALMTFESLDTLKLRQLPIASPNGEHLQSPSPMRNVPGWATGSMLFDCLVGLYANDCKQPPLFVGATCSPGFESVLQSDASVTCRPCRECRSLSLGIGFDRSDGASGAIEALWRQRLEPEEEILTATRLPATACALPGCCFSQDLAINPVWWEIAASDFKSELNTACGCADGHCHHG